MKPISDSDPELDLPPLSPACAATQEALVEANSAELQLPTEIAEHLKNCSVCRAFQAFLPVLRDGLSRLPSVRSSEGAVSEVLRATLKDRRTRIQRKIGVGLAIAASILIGVIAVIPGNDKQRPVTAQKQAPVSVQPEPPAPGGGLESTVPAIRDTILEARSTVVTNLQRTAEETVESTLSWLPGPMVVPDADPLQPLEPAVNSLSEVGQGAAVSVQPLADSARRAVGLFWKELPSID